MQDFIKKFHTLISGASHIGVVAHERPDGDSIGSTMALFRFIQDNYNGQVTPFCNDTISSSLDFLLPPGGISTTITKDLDLLVVLDNANPTRIALDNIPDNVPIINIDHHGSNQNYGTLNLVLEDAPSTTSILFNVFSKLGDISPITATALLTGLYTDTGWFLHRNTNSVSFSQAALLSEKGAKIGEITHNIFKSYSQEFLQNLGKLLSRIQVINGVGFCSMHGLDDLKDKELKTTVVTMANSVKDAHMSCVLQPDPKGVRWSFRTSSDTIDVCSLAAVFGGGGHQKAAGFLIEWAHLSEEGIIWLEDEILNFEGFISKYCQ